MFFTENKYINPQNVETSFWNIIGLWLNRKLQIRIADRSQRKYLAIRHIL